MSYHQIAQSEFPLSANRVRLICFVRISQQTATISVYNIELNEARICYGMGVNVESQEIRDKGRTETTGE